MDTVERLDRERRRMLAGFVVAFGAWQLPAIVEGFAGGALPQGAATVLAVTAFAGSIGFIVYMVRLMRLRRRIGADAVSARALDDERVRAARVRAMQIGFVTMLVVTAALRLLTVGLELRAPVVLQACLVAGVVGAIVAFLRLDRD